MLESFLVRKNCSFKVKVTVKSLITALVIALSVALPQIVHLFAGNAGGVKWLPMYLPVLIGGCLLGVKWGLIAGVFAPLASFLVTSAVSSPMPALERLPFMMVELGVYALVSGAFSEKIAENGWYAFPAVLLAEVSGRATFMLLVLVFGSLTSSLNPSLVWGQIQTGLLAVVLQAVIVPFIVMLLRKPLIGEKKQ